ncbi:hypothetical protein FIBSPDRAFT_857578 [Athelia psychrophila]|uniref:Uncharacterized protein n=1 Tax=Athelia psychrophila TaxID=1759441 RepID=A0A166MLY8_9AGAM|nr:hypothetical protein FIBSPDRAFT_857578 [Fibularhizoctonia sp. CBS 109695]
MSTLQLLPIRPTGRSTNYRIDQANFVLPIVDLKRAFVHRANAGYPIHILKLPEHYFEQGQSLASCTEPPVQVLQYTYARPSDLPEW